MSTNAQTTTDHYQQVHCNWSPIIIIIIIIISSSSIPMQSSHNIPVFIISSLCTSLMKSQMMKLRMLMAMMNHFHPTATQQHLITTRFSAKFSAEAM